VAYFNVTTNTFALADPLCPNLFRSAMFSLSTTLGHSSSYNTVSQQFSLCPPIKSADDAQNFLEWIEGSVQYIAMTDYPYPNDFLEPVGASVVNAFCAVLRSKQINPVAGVAAAMGVYFNYTGTTTCYNMSVEATGALGDAAWDYQSCTEIVMPISSNGTSDMFLPSYFDLQGEISYCKSTYGVTPNIKWYQSTFGAMLDTSSNIVFSNGNLDPWSSGGILQAPNSAITTVLIHGGAHHLDLRLPVPQYDPPGVVVARAIELEQILSWIN